MAFLADAQVKRFQPMNVSFGLFPPLPRPEGRKQKRRERNEQMVERALGAFAPFAEACSEWVSA
jgi:folate-dependent tRNA-U54 methylase TrmFO/GidA